MLWLNATMPNPLHLRIAVGSNPRLQASIFTAKYFYPLNHLVCPWVTYLHCSVLCSNHFPHENKYFTFLLLLFPFIHPFAPTHTLWLPPGLWFCANSVGVCSHSIFQSPGGFSLPYVFCHVFPCLTWFPKKTKLRSIISIWNLKCLRGYGPDYFLYPPRPRSTGLLVILF